MKAIPCIIAALGFHAVSLAQDPVHFSYEAKKLADKKYEIHVTATIDEGWHIYSQTQPKEAIAQPTKIVFTKNPLVAVTPGKFKEIGKKETYENTEVGIRQFQYARQVEFVQIVTLKAAVKTNLTGTLTYEACTDERCLPTKEIPFTVPLQ